LAAVSSMPRRELAALVASAVLKVRCSHLEHETCSFFFCLILFINFCLSLYVKVLSSREGDVLVFLPGEGEIRETGAALGSQMGGRLSSAVEVTPLYAGNKFSKVLNTLTSSNNYTKALTFHNFCQRCRLTSRHALCSRTLAESDELYLLPLSPSPPSRSPA
jgi:hypothetical protein